jgi:16S rRNA processing protein RimM
MFLKEDCYRLGNIAKLHSFKGELTIFLDVDDPLEYNELESVFVEYDNKLIPFFLEKIQIRKNGFAVVKFEDVDTERHAKSLLKCGLYMPLDTLPQLEENEFYYHEIEDFQVIDKNHGEIGIVVKVIDLSNNPLIEINFNGNEILIPKRDEFINRIDWEQKKLHVHLPEGLLEMYLGTDGPEDRDS